MQRAITHVHIRILSIFYLIIGPKPPTDFTADIVFLMDASVDRRDYIKEKNFVKELARQMNLAPGKSRASIVAYGRSPYLISRLGGYSSLVDFERKVDSAISLSGPRRIDSALQAARQVLNEARPNHPKIAVLVTAGRQDPNGPRLNAAAEPLRRSGVKTFVVAIGSTPDSRELQPVVEKQEDIFRISSFDQLSPETRSVVEKIINRNSK